MTGKIESKFRFQCRQHSCLCFNFQNEQLRFTIFYPVEEILLCSFQMKIISKFIFEFKTFCIFYLRSRLFKTDELVITGIAFYDRCITF